MRQTPALDIVSHQPQDRVGGGSPGLRAAELGLAVQFTEKQAGGLGDSVVNGGKSPTLHGDFDQRFHVPG